MNRERIHFLFLNLGHTLDHLLMLLFPTVVLALETEFQQPYEKLLPLSVGGFVAFGAGALPAGWLADRWSRHGMMLVFFAGIGIATMLTGLAVSPWSLAAGLTLIGVFASIYHPVGIALVVQRSEGMGRRLGVNSLAGNVGVAGAAITAGALADLIHWRAAFLIPGAFALLAAVGYFFVAQGNTVKKPAPPKQGTSGFSGLSPIRLFTVLLLATLLGGFMFNTTLMALPKVFSVRLGEITTSATAVSAMVSLVYLCGALAQLLVGVLMDRVSLRSIMMGLAALQIPMYLIVSQLSQLSLVLSSVFLMFVIFGVIPLTDALVARNTADHIRSRVYAVKFLSAFGVSALAAPMVALVYGLTGEFVVLFYIFAACAGALVVTSLLMPGETPGAEPAPAIAGGN